MQLDIRARLRHGLHLLSICTARHAVTAHLRLWPQLFGTCRVWLAIVTPVRLGPQLAGACRMRLAVSAPVRFLSQLFGTCRMQLALDAPLRCGLQISTICPVQLVIARFNPQLLGVCRVVNPFEVLIPLQTAGRTRKNPVGLDLLCIFLFNFLFNLLCGILVTANFSVLFDLLVHSIVNTRFILPELEEGGILRRRDLRHPRRSGQVQLGPNDARAEDLEERLAPSLCRSQAG
mmetsp:Transcript_44782/g.126714  ORF Transcript_44782/g.126714 Transcript_44782/m.126714 type:complete len:233 (+) Transcript_44782:243-941(+)